MDPRTDPRHLFDEVIATPDPFEFVRRAYRLVLRREASDAEVRWRGRLIKYVPFYTRDRFLRRLLLSPEAGLIGRATVTAGEALLLQGVARERAAREAVAGVGGQVQLVDSHVQAVEGRIQAVEAWVRAVETRVQATETRLLAAVQALDAVLAPLAHRVAGWPEPEPYPISYITERLDRLEGVVAPLADRLGRWPEPEPYPVSYITERLDRLEGAAMHMRAWTEKVEAELRAVTGPILHDQKAEWRRAGDLRAFERKVFSQQGEDGILEEIFRRIGETNRYFVEFGVETGVECNSARFARECGWSGLFMESEEQQFAGLTANYAAFPGVKCVRAIVTSDNVQGLFAAAGVPAEPDLLSIDIDGNDYWIWKAISDYRPRVVVVEFNPFYPPPARWVMAEDPTFRWQRTTYFGASLAALSRLGKAKGYELVCTDSHGVNSFFVRADCLTDEFLDPVAQYHFSPFTYRPHPHVDGASVEG